MPRGIVGAGAGARFGKREARKVQFVLIPLLLALAGGALSELSRCTILRFTFIPKFGILILPV